jgi:hypothetical protein
MADAPIATTFAQAIKYRSIADQQGLNSGDMSEPDTIKRLAYKVYVVAGEAQYNGQTGFTVEAWLPETLSTDIAATYDSPLAQGLNGMLPGIGAMARFIGLNLTSQALTTQVWQGGGHIQFTLPLVFQAENDAAADVMEPIKQLFSLTLPKDESGGGLLSAPGPHLDAKKLLSNGGAALFDQAKGTLKGLYNTGASIVGGAQFDKSQGEAMSLAQASSRAIVNSVKNNISLHLGQFMYFPSVIVKDVSPTFDVILSKDKNPIRATVNVNFETFYIPTSQDLETMFPATAHLRKTAR